MFALRTAARLLCDMFSQLMGHEFDSVSESEELIDDDREHGDFMGPELWCNIWFGSMNVCIN